MEHLRRLAGLGVEGAIVGRALYTGDIDPNLAIGRPIMLTKRIIPRLDVMGGRGGRLEQ